ncbi:MAG: hypothetical protein HC890_13760 [Chloroflexaceae bacterium]|nr:hypothetical protein [Chloroflexaceae bacterium]
MIEFVVIVESSADARTATKLAERVLVEKVDWLETNLLEHLFQWRGLEEITAHSCWRDISDIIERAKESGLPIPKFLGHKKTGTLKADGAVAMKILNLIQIIHIKKNRPIKAVLFIRDLDHQPERRQGIEQARSEQGDRQSNLEIIIGTANRMREAWVLNGFIPANPEEDKILQEIKAQLTFDPCEKAHRLRSSSWNEPERIRNPKVVVELLTQNTGMLRECQCWEETSLEHLRERGVYTGLTDYLNEIEQRLVPVISPQTGA